MDEGAIRRSLERSGYIITAEQELPGRRGSHAPIPSGLSPRVLQAVRKKHPGGLYLHQARALEALLRGRDVCLSTSTASGKSLVFQAMAAHVVLERPEARAIALYPMRALLQDQLEKWRALLGPLGRKVGLIDGGVPGILRTRILQESGVLLMTPDVAHAWLLGKQSDPSSRAFLGRVRLLVLDEAHVYDGVFGTNMAYLLRRFQALAGDHQVVVSTATIGQAPAFVESLTGRSMEHVGPDEDGTESAGKTLLLARPTGEGFESAAALVRELAGGSTRFLVLCLLRSHVGRRWNHHSATSMQPRDISRPNSSTSNR